jgi:hypothetical protein
LIGHGQTDRQTDMHKHKAFLVIFSFLFVTEHTAFGVVRWRFLFFVVEVLMTGRFGKYFHYNFLILFPKI